ncbi:hypothetical protein [Clostridium tunisiense]|uniref:hypothetical protein n=1 Tax=Clostridium tunisiense TaxID=219748 RepID=UPI003F6E1C8B
MSNLSQGRENSKVYLKENPKIPNEIENLIREKYKLPLTKIVIREEPVEENMNSNKEKQ